MHDNDCIFCKILQKKIPSVKVFEDENCYAFFDINPIAKGHTVVIPKKHYKNLINMPDSIMQGFFSGLKKTAKLIMEKLEPDGFNILQNNEKAAGQAVFHVHFHIIPRWNDDGLLDGFKKFQKKADPDELKELANNLN